MSNGLPDGFGEMTLTSPSRRDSGYRSFPNTPGSQHDDSMETDDMDSGRGSRSRSSSVNGTGTTGSASRDMVITAGIGLGSPRLGGGSPFSRRRRGPGASVSHVVSTGDGQEEGGVSSATVMRPNGNNDSAGIRPNYSSQPNGNSREALGVVTIGEVGKAAPKKKKVPAPSPPKPAPEPTMQIFVRNHDGRTYTFVVTKITLVDELMKMIYDKLGLPPEQQRLQFDGKNLTRGVNLQHYGIRAENTLFLTGRLRGG